MKEQFEQESLLLNNDNKKVVASGQGELGLGGLGCRGGGSCPPVPVEPAKSSLWMYLFSLDSVILIVVTLLFAIFKLETSLQVS